MLWDLTLLVSLSSRICSSTAAGSECNSQLNWTRCDRACSAIRMILNELILFGHTCAAWSLRTVLSTVRACRACQSSRAWWGRVARARWCLPSATAGPMSWVQWPWPCPICLASARLLLLPWHRAHLSRTNCEKFGATNWLKSISIVSLLIYNMSLLVEHLTYLLFLHADVSRFFNHERGRHV